MTMRIIAAAAALAISSTAAAQASTIFAVFAPNAHAERLAYGDAGGALTPTSSPFFDTSLSGAVHTGWRQVIDLGDGGRNDDIVIDWLFDDAQTISDRMLTAQASGVAVSWSITDNVNGLTPTLDGEWWFSDTAGLTAARLSGTGGGLSNDDGFWGAGRVANGDISNGGPGPRPDLLYGIGNIDSGDGSLVYVNGVASSNAGYRSYLSLAPQPVPGGRAGGVGADVPVPAALPLALTAFGGLGWLARRRKRA
ncbi:MAG: VPLPA-CTERM sorting domain-containing protein [Pseudomonadota bacterium]